jgi:hypothetical protein
MTAEPIFDDEVVEDKTTLFLAALQGGGNFANVDIVRGAMSAAVRWIDTVAPEQRGQIVDFLLVHLADRRLPGPQQE